MGRTDRAGLVAEMARSFPSRRRWRGEVMALLDREVGYSDSMFHLMDPSLPLDRGTFVTEVPRDLISRALTNWRTRYNPELAPLWMVAAQRGGVVVDTDVLGPHRRDRIRFYGEIGCHMGIDHFMWCHLDVHGENVSTVVLARRGSGFGERDQQVLRELRDVLAISEACYRATPRVLDGEVQARLTPRELEIVDLVVRGLTNPEIATALALSLHTVRNHLNTIFRKLEVSTRAELAGMAATRS